MKHIFTAAIAIAVLSLSSCGVTTKVTYGDISVLDYGGKVIRQWDNATMDVVVTDNYSGEKLYRSYAIKDGGGLSFTDNTGESHYTSGGIIIVDNIRTTNAPKEESVQQYNNSPNPEKEKLNAEYKEVQLQIRHNNEILKYKQNLTKDELKDLKQQNKDLKKRMYYLENKLRWNLHAAIQSYQSNN